jgi:hypothetical protein
LKDNAQEAKRLVSGRTRLVTKNTKVILLAGIAAVIAVVLVLVGRDMFIRRQHEFNCEDGPRRTIDIRDFATRYSAYSLDLEATIKDKATVATKVTPSQLQQLSEAVQNSQEFRKFVVAGYNSCAITKTQYGDYGARFQALDGLAREINQLAGSPSLSPDQSKNLTTLIAQYAELARNAGSQPQTQPTTTIQTTEGAGSPAVHDVHGDVAITVDQSTGKTATKKTKEQEPSQEKSKQ